MNICQEHWDALRDKINSRGLQHLIAPSGIIAAEQAKDQFERARQDHDTATPTNFDPLMWAFWAIGSNVMNIVSQSGNNPLYLLAPPGTPEDPVSGYGKQYEHRTWPRCGICYLNLAHEVSCTDSRCRLDKVRGYDFFLDRAADDAREKAAELGLIST